MPTVVSESVVVDGPGGVITEGFDVLVRRGVYVVSRQDSGLVGLFSHHVDVFGDVYGFTNGIKLGVSDVISAQSVVVHDNAIVSGGLVGIDVSGLINRVYNLGTVVGMSSGIFTDNTSRNTTSNVVVNHGIISGGNFAIYAKNAAVFLKNYGEI